MGLITANFANTNARAEAGARPWGIARGIGGETPLSAQADGARAIGYDWPASRSPDGQRARRKARRIVQGGQGS